MANGNDVMASVRRATLKSTCIEMLSYVLQPSPHAHQLRSVLIFLNAPLRFAGKLSKKSISPLILI